MGRKTTKIGNTTIKIEDNSKEVLKELSDKVDMILKALGEKWRSIVTKEITARKIVDTGRLRGSMDYQINKAKKQVIVGSPIKYAAKNEFDNPKGPYLKPSILNYKKSYELLTKQILKK